MPALRVCGIAVCISTLFCMADSANAKKYSFTDLGFWSGSPSINLSGEVAGGSPGWVWKEGIFRPLVGINGTQSTATSINDNGSVVGYSYTDFSRVASHATYWSNEKVRDLGTLGGNNSYAFGINNANQIVGSSGVTLEDNTQRATLWSDGKIIQLDSSGSKSSSAALDINNYGTIVGNSSNHAAVWQGATITDIGNGLYSSAMAINDTGTIVGFSAFSRNIHAVIWSGEKLFDIGALGGTDSIAHDINNSGEVVGISSSSREFDSLAFLWSSGVATDLNDFLSSDEISDGWHLTSANSINNFGDIAGQAIIDGAPHSFLMHPVTEVPEPSTFILFLMSLGALGVILRRSK